MTERLQETLTTHKWAIIVSMALLPIGGLLGIVWAIIVMAGGTLSSDKQGIFRGMTLLSIMAAMTTIALVATQFTASTTQTLISMGAGMLLFWGFLALVLRRTGNLRDTLRGLSGVSSSEEQGHSETDHPSQKQEQTGSDDRGPRIDVEDAEIIDEGQCTQCGTENVSFASYCRECGGKVR